MNNGLSIDAWEQARMLDDVLNKEQLVKLLNEGIEVIVYDLADEGLQTEFIMLIRDFYLRGVLVNVPVLYSKFNKFKIKVNFENDMRHVLGDLNVRTEMSWIKRSEFIRNYLEGEFNSI